VATCQAAGLDFVEDQTNFQTRITPRNDIRASLSSYDRAKEIMNSPFKEIPKDGGPISPKQAIKSLVLKVHEGTTPANLSIPLGNYISSVNLKREKLEMIAEMFLNSARLPSPPGTFCLDPLVIPPEDPEAQRGIILRILRYVSPLPWGSPQAEAGRRTKKLDTIRNRIWISSPESPRSFTGGGQVLWSFLPKIAGRKEHSPVWIASRLPHRRKDSLEVCLNEAFLRGQQTEMLWDGRFRITFRPSLLNANWAKKILQGRTWLTIIPKGIYSTPALLLRDDEGGLNFGPLHLIQADSAGHTVPEAFQVEWARKLFDRA